MHTRRCLLFLAAAVVGAGSSASLSAADPLLQATTVTVSNNQKTVTWAPYPSVQQYSLFSSDDVAGPYNLDLSGVLLGNSWVTTNTRPQQFFRIGATPISSNALLSATVLNRLAYGPTPEELENLATNGPQQYIDSQLAMQGIVETGDAYVVSFATNGVNPPTTPQWKYVEVSARVTGTSRSNLYVYLTAPGDVYLDDLQLRAPTNNVNTGNLLVNGDFESPLAGSWTVSANVAGSALSSTTVHGGVSSLHVVASSAGSGQASSIWQTVAPVLRDNETVVLSFWYLQTSNSSRLTIRSGGSSPTATGMDQLSPPKWVYATASGVATATPTLYLYLSGTGEAYVDDVKLVAGTVPEAGPNLLPNGDFESGVIAPWIATSNFLDTAVSSDVSFTGTKSLKLVATAAGSGNGNALFQTNLPVINGQTYTVSFWYIPATSNRTITVRLSGSATPGLLQATPDNDLSGLRRRLDTTGIPSLDTLHGATVDAVGGVSLTDLQAWFALNAVSSKRQLHEVLSQFFENHFVTYHAKSVDYLDQYYDGGILDRFAADWEFREMKKWRQAMLDPNCTFYDLLKISAESPAMIVYLDTVNSRGNGNNIANENYARELLELFCNGVDNGYDQNDILQCSRAWTGWSVELVDPVDFNNPFAAPSTVLGFYPGVGSNAKSNVVGLWTFNYKQANHNTNPKYLFYNWDATGTNRLGPKTVPARFGAPWAGQNYSLVLTNGTGTNGIRDGYQVIQHLANLPFAMEYLSVKLCRLFVHDDFPNPTTRAGLPEYDFYDYTNPNASDEAKLVRACMGAWETAAADGRKGNLRAVLRTIFDSQLFRTHAAAQQKVKTPFEFTVSAVRALRSANANSTSTVTVDGYAFATAMNRTGPMSLFNRAEPDGYPEVAPPWISAGTISERVRFVQALLTAAGSANRPSDAGNNAADPVALLKKKLPAASWNNAGAVADYFVGLLFPAEGAGNLALYRKSAIDFLNSDDNGVSNGGTQFVSLINTQATYDTRVRGMVAMLMTFQRFQEQ